MTRKLEFTTRAPQSGTTKSMVVFLHGYGANGADLMGLADPLGPQLPDTVFVAPDAPDKIPGAPFGFQWFPIPWIDGSTEEAAGEGLLKASADLNAFLDEQLKEHSVKPENCIILGFSQGTMLALHVAVRRDEAVAGVVAFSGRLLVPERLEEEAVSKPPVILIHGDQDDVVPPQSLPEAGDALSVAGFEVYAHVMEGTGHGIAPDGLTAANHFMRQKLGYT
ncbi:MULTISPECIES: alpha/beta hydrolase [Halocynthiibacter]|uniref:Dienelactone hydrolase family protein n=1 Tax=Halocynthiibacter halioticoli TaxID=2986804 RepID=A0AAE3J030_9RHOB|nr:MULTISPECIES: alpha/beta fold hydrolase [Halocynthiibacter]MCV6824255.1 dienelactone hydrolase family protein [Halocynthiibacter halioticoli]MCW4057256.1 dienelactone hydrolase family protein [Halocynthiibacter sp. SDUM655004]